ncbi:putative multidrug ABC transporter ATP-binding protein YbhF [anaerobic digester metagenome]
MEQVLAQAPTRVKLEPTDASAIEVMNLKKVFGSFVAVNGISFKVRKGEVFGFLGPNGSGKTTVIRMILGLLTPTSGQGRVLGLDVGTDSRRLRDKVGYMSQKFSLYEELTVTENLDFYAGIYDLSKERRDQKKREILNLAGMTGKENTIVSNLSGGWKQRLALGCSIIHDPQILLLDEPTGGVDPIARRQFWDIIYELSKAGVTILVTTHYMDEAEHCNTIGFLYYGNILAMDAPKQLKETAIDGTILEIRADQTLKAIECLNQHPLVKNASVYGSGIHVLVDPETDPDEVMKFLADQRIRVERLRVAAPSLEDVFVYLVERERGKTKQLNRLKPAIKATGAEQ